MGKHSPDLRFQDTWSPELSARRDIEQLIIRDAAPQEERQPGGQLEIADQVDGIRWGSRGIAFDAEQELRRHQESRQRLLDAALEAPLTSTGPVEPQQRLDVRLGDRPAIGPTGERRQDLLRAGLLSNISGPGWLTDKECGAGSVYPRACGVVRTFEPYIIDIHPRSFVGRAGVPRR